MSMSTLTKNVDATLLCLLCLVASVSCASDKSAAPTRSNSSGSSAAMSGSSNSSPVIGSGKAAASAGSSATTSSNGASAATAGSAGTATSTPPTMRPPPPAAGCEPTALDQAGCYCDKPTATRPCYSADPKTRNIGMCKDGIQTCMGDNSAGVEFGAKWGPCNEQVVPTECKEQLDARCVGKVGCEDPECMTKLSCVKDAGMPDAGKRNCINVMGWGVGTGFFPDGGMWCER